MPSLLLLILAAVAAASEPTSAKGNLQGLFSAEDYPLAALHKGEQGTATVRLYIDAEGFVSSCKVIVSSGSQALDDQTCSVLRARAKFDPAKDARGRPVKSEFLQRITWRLAGREDAPLPRHQPWSVLLTFTTDPDGKLAGCEIEFKGLAEKPDDCEIMTAFAKSQDAWSDRAAAPKIDAITQVHFYPVDPTTAPTPPKIVDATQVVSQTSRLTISPAGEVTACDPVSQSGSAPQAFDPCRQMQGRQFDPSPEPSSGTVVVTVYGRTRSVT